MIIVVALGILVGTVTLVLASVVLRAGKHRSDNRLFAAMAALSGFTTLTLAVDQATTGFLIPTGVGRVELVVEGAMASLALLFAHAFPQGRKPPRWLWACAGMVWLFVLWIASGEMSVERARTLQPWILIVPYVVSIVLLFRQRTMVAPPARMILWVVAATFAARWLFICSLVHHGGIIPTVSTGLRLPDDAVSVVQMLVIGWLVLRYHLLDVRRVFREAALAWMAAVGVSLYAALVLAIGTSLRRNLGDGGAIVVGFLPLVLVAWAAWTFRDEFGSAARALDPHRGIRRELMERILSVTGHVVDPEAVLAMIRAAMLEALPEAQVVFRRAPGLALLRGISAKLPKQLQEALEDENGSVVDVATLVERDPSLASYWKEGARTILLPVRRDGVLYGVFEVEGLDRVDTDDLLTVSAMAEHLAVKLENLSLSSSLGQAGRELENIRTFLEDLIASLPVGIVGISGPNLEVRLWNSFEARRTGVQPADVVGKRYLEEVAACHLEASIVEAIRKQPTEVLSFPNVGWSDQCRDKSVDVTVAPLRMRAGTERGYVLILVDATERNVLQREVEEFRRLAALGQFAAAIAHDIRTPLSAIRMSVQILRSKVDLPDEDMEYFDLTLEAISRLGRDVEELLDFTKPTFLRVDDVALHEVVEDARDAVVSGLASDVTIELDVPSDLEVPIDEVYVRRMLMNLLQNAVQASEPGGCVWLQATCNGDEVSLVVRDEGKGIEAEDLDRIWEPFFTTRTDGTGLGLALVRKTVTAHGGRVSVQSEVGVGTRLEVVLPAKRATEVVVPIEEYRNRAPSQAMQNALGARERS